VKISTSWLLLLYGLPTRRGTARVNLWRKLKMFGALPFKTSAYILPDEPLHHERFQWLAKQIQDQGGEATLIGAAKIEGLSNNQIVHQFNEARTAEYKQLSNEIQKNLKKHLNPDSTIVEFQKFQKRFKSIHQIDYFHAPAGQDTQMLLHRLERRKAPQTRAGIAPKLNREKFLNKTWITRPRPGIDRAGSAWLIRKFIDPKAKFIFGMEPERYPEALAFDMFNVEFSHHGEDCTFETLVKRFDISDKAVLKMAEMVHDADLEDNKFQRCECIGINGVLGGWAKSGMSDYELLVKGIECFEGLYKESRQ
jgi:hypothetical protein